MLTRNEMLFFNELVNILLFLVLVVNAVNIDQYNPHKQSLLGSSIMFKSLKVPEIRKLEIHQSRQ